VVPLVGKVVDYSVLESRGHDVEYVYFVGLDRGTKVGEHHDGDTNNLRVGDCLDEDMYLQNGVVVDLHRGTKVVSENHFAR
jgi:hypothetical protein